MTLNVNKFLYDSAWRVAVAPDYVFTPSPLAGEGGGLPSNDSIGGEGTNVIDLEGSAKASPVFEERRALAVIPRDGYQ